MFDGCVTNVCQPNSQCELEPLTNGESCLGLDGCNGQDGMCNSEGQCGATSSPSLVAATGATCGQYAMATVN